MDEVLRMMIPILALSIPLVAVAGRVIIQPIVGAITRLAEAQQQARAAGSAGGDERLARVEERMAELEQQLHRMLEEQTFQRELLSGRPPQSPQR